MDNGRPHVVIVGAGIAGLTLAVALHRKEIPFQVYEQAPDLREVGAGIQLAPNATSLLARLGLAESLRRHAVAPQAMEFRRWQDSAVLARSPLGEECERIFGAPYYAAHRADLHRDLANALPAGSVELNRRCIGVEEGVGRHEGKVVVYFEDGTDLAADVAVGADGIHSVVRGSTVVDRPKYSGQSVYRGLVPAERVEFLLTEPKVILWLGPGQHFVCYPIAGGRLVNFVATFQSEHSWDETWQAEGELADVREPYRDWNEELLAVIDAAGSVTRWGLFDRDPIDKWSTAHTTLVGDSAHPALPFMGQGANQAIEDAAVLAGCLAATGPDGVAAALARYEDVRLPRTRMVQERSRSNGKVFHLGDGADQSRRDQAITTLDLAGQDWLYGYDAEAALRPLDRVE